MKNNRLGGVNTKILNQ